jgi:DNA-binding GntR family transcriptional regulator
VNLSALSPAAIFVALLLARLPEGSRDEDTLVRATHWDLAQVREALAELERAGAVEGVKATLEVYQ